MANTTNEKPALATDQRQPSNVDGIAMDSPPPPRYEDVTPTSSHQNLPIAKEDIDTLSRAPTPLPGNTKTLKFHHASFPWRHVNVLHPSGTAAYYAEISEASPKRPDVLLRAPGRDGAAVGRSHFRFSRSMRVGIGPDDLNAEWIELKSTSLLSKRGFEFEYRGRGYRLQRTHAKENGVDGVLRKVNLNHFKVVDVGPANGSGEGGEEVVAVYVSETFHPGRMKGTLTLREGAEEGLEVLIVLGVVGWREKKRRRAAYSSHGGGGGGGG